MTVILVTVEGVRRWVPMTVSSYDGAVLVTVWSA